ncbi:MAG: methyltransferase domain-containing protein [Chitinivibrionales bacterium]|nr:methyltransferase domain-containing protein [Chitinivibrionales bacterium]
MAQSVSGMSMECPLCREPHTVFLGADGRREYYHCQTCALRFVPPKYHVGIHEEKARYALHTNDGEDKQYIGYLGRIVSNIQKIARPGGRILDFGSGEHAALTSLLKKAGYECAAYDPLYGVGGRALEKKYNCVVLCEVIEHLRKPAEELRKIWKALVPGGTAFIKTAFYPDSNFLSWWYKEDITHICFFSQETFRYVEHLLENTASCTITRHFILLRKYNQDDA